ncbi:MAG: sulfate ABC transporter ATP-binding protein [Thermoguttaceae bacterium]|nr:sulfate ABC transporter ATP-binding protein [Thermoguttaceae bacterium]
MSIEVKNITKWFGQFKALDNVSLTVNSGELVALLGPSGSGKTTLLRIIAGLEAPSDDEGQILFSGADVSDHKVGDRNVGFVFQHYALFRNMTVFDNIAFGLNVRPRATRPTKQEIHDKVMELLRLIQLESFADRYPNQLSGGQRQRVALARALAVEPQILLLDEPFGALDAKVRVELRAWLRRLHDQIHLTSVFVTHDQEEALELADRVAVMSNGKIEQFDTPDIVFHHPASEFVMNFLGTVNQFSGRVSKGLVQIGQYKFRIPDDVNLSESGTAAIFVRPHDVAISNHPQPDKICLRALVKNVHSAGAHVRVDLITETNDELTAELSHQENEQLHVTPGQNVFVHLRNLRIFGQASALNSEDSI